MKIGIFGGTFDPPHLGHQTAAEAAIKSLNLDLLLFIPTGLPPHKSQDANGASPEQRFEMTAILADSLHAKVSNVELNRAGKSYTADTIEELCMQYPDDELWLIVGADMFLSLQTWHEPERIFKHVGIAAFAREKENDERAFAAQAQKLDTKYGVQLIENPNMVEISSSEIRRKLAENEDISHVLLQPVYGYILRHALYGTQLDLKCLDDEKLRAVSYSMLKAKRLAHVRGTEETAVKLAAHWGENVNNARRAAILHDCTKYWEPTEQLALCKRYGVILDELETQGAKFLHAKTGALLARHLFGEPDAVYDAIFCHTTGKPNMTRLDQILYLAD
ncbi:MAG: nicotinate-nucleotide adenylyltransferase, partial [Evtepia sp.]